MTNYRPNGPGKADLAAFLAESERKAAAKTDATLKKGDRMPSSGCLFVSYSLLSSRGKRPVDEFLGDSSRVIFVMDEMHRVGKRGGKSWVAMKACSTAGRRRGSWASPRRGHGHRATRSTVRHAAPRSAHMQALSRARRRATSCSCRVVRILEELHHRDGSVNIAFQTFGLPRLTDLALVTLNRPVHAVLVRKVMPTLKRLAIHNVHDRYISEVLATDDTFPRMALSSVCTNITPSWCERDAEKTNGGAGRQGLKRRWRRQQKH